MYGRYEYEEDEEETGDENLYHNTRYVFRGFLDGTVKNLESEATRRALIDSDDRVLVKTTISTSFGHRVIP